MMSSKVFIITVNWNSFADTSACLDSLRTIDYSPYHVIVVDNGSTDGSAPLIRQRYPEVILLENKSNLGLAAANNIGIRHALSQGADFGLILNNDTAGAPALLQKIGPGHII